jgi:hypothetical protein
MSLKIDKARSNIDDIQIVFDLETMGASETLTGYFKDQIADSIDKHIIKQLNDMWVQVDHRPKNLSLNDVIELDRYAFPSYVSIDYKDNKTPLIPIVL